MDEQYMTEAMMTGINAAASVPIMKLATLSQAAANLAKVAEVAHQVCMGLGPAPTDPGVLTVWSHQKLELIKLRDDAMARAATLIAQIKDE